MPKFTYTAMDSKGGETTGTIDADSQSAAVNQLREKGLFPTNVAEENAAAKPAAKKDGKGGTAAPGKGAGAPAQAAGSGLKMSLNVSALWGGSGVKPKTLTVFTRQLATLVDAGLPLLRSLSVLMRQEKNPIFKNILGNLSTAVESGGTFSEALYGYPKVFSKLYVNMVKAGEVGGVLEVVLNRLAVFMEKAEKIKGKVKAAMFYPIAVLVIAIAILSFLMVFIVPKFKVIFDDMLNGAPLPVFTQIVLNFSSTIANNIIWIILGIGMFWGGIKYYGKTKGGRLTLDKFKMRAPLFGDLVRKTAVARFTRTLGTLVSSGVPILQALLIVKETSGNREVADAVGRIHDSVKEGESVVRPLEASGVFPPMVVSMVDVGETTGALPDMLIKVADVFDEEVDNSVAGMISLLEPIMIVFLAFVVGSIVIALFLPMVDIIKNLNKEQ